MADLIAELKELRLYGMACAYAESLQQRSAMSLRIASRTIATSSKPATIRTSSGTAAAPRRQRIKKREARKHQSQPDAEA